MLAEAKANGFDLPIDIDLFSTAIMSGRPHPEVHLQFGRHDGIIGRTNLHCWKSDPRESVLAAWLCELDTIAVSVMYVQTGRLQHRRDLWHPHSRTGSKRFQIADLSAPTPRRRVSAKQNGQFDAKFRRTSMDLFSSTQPSNLLVNANGRS
jgi:hypothetical protein